MPITVFPNLAHKGYEVTSPPTAQYNCFAWAAADAARRWEPDSLGSQYWPDGIVRECTVNAVIQAFRVLGYEECSDDTLESGFEKIAIYTKGDTPQHAARQLEDGRWTSKLGDREDITHDIAGVQGRVYGSPNHFLKRRRP